MSLLINAPAPGGIPALVAHQGGWDEILLVAGPMALIAGLAAEGETVITGAHHIDRGYDDLVGRLRGVGAHIERC